MQPRHARGIASAAIITIAACGQAAQSPTAPAPSPTTYALSGIVNAMAPDGATIPEAQVRILDAPAANPTLTNANGEFNVAALAAGWHLVEISKTGFQVWETDITIVDRDLRISATLSPIVR
jgi:Carboxypeptidase regulatory-like domain